MNNLINLEIALQGQLLIDYEALIRLVIDYTNIINEIKEANKVEDIRTLHVSDLIKRYPNIMANLYQRTSADNNTASLWIYTILQLEKYIANLYTVNNMLFPLQKEAILFIALAIAKGHLSNYISMPTGSGKTAIFLQIASALGLKTIITAPTVVIVEQILDKINKYNLDIDCGGFHAYRKELDHDVLVITFDSLFTGLKTGLIQPEEYELIIVDEAHQTITQNRESGLKLFKNSIQLFFTATEEYDRNKRLTLNCAYKLSIKDAVAYHLMSPFKCIIARTSFDLSSVDIVDHKYNSDSLASVLNTKRMNVACVKFCHDNFPNKTIFIFVSNIEHSEALEAEFNAAHGYGYATSFNIYTKGHENIISNANSGQTRVIIGITKLATGFDLPTASVCINISPTFSRVYEAQRCGRVLRLDTKNRSKVAIIVDFLYKDFRKPSSQILFPEIVGKSEVLNEGCDFVSGPIKHSESIDLSLRKKREGLDIDYHDPINIEIVVDRRKIYSILEQRSISKQAPEEELRTWSLNDLQETVQSLRVKSVKEYLKLAPEYGWPSENKLTNMIGWIDFYTFFDKPRRIPWGKVIIILKENNITSKAEYLNLRERYLNLPIPIELPSTNTIQSKSEWTGSWLGLIRTEIEVLSSIEEIRNFLAEIDEINSSTTYNSLNSKYPQLPSYKAIKKLKDWKGWDFIFDRNSRNNIEILRNVTETAKSNGIDTSIKYKAVYKNLGLPSKSTIETMPEFPGWKNLLNGVY